MNEYLLSRLNKKEKKESGRLKWHHLVTPATRYEWLHVSTHEATFAVRSFVEQPAVWP